jgi:feruloyl esterase
MTNINVKHFSALAVATLSLAHAVPAMAQDCERLASFAFDGVEVGVESTAHVAAVAAPVGGSIPAHCRVDGVLDERVGVNGVTYGVRFALALPDNWNGRFLFQGGGGLNGSVRNPVGDTAAGSSSALSRGFAVVSTDTGHQGTGFDASFMEDQQAALDFFYAANTRLTPVAKAMIAAHYGRDIDYSYFVGCSTGGREGMVMSQRNPTFFDGIVSGAPAMRTGHSNMALAYINAAFSEFAPRDADGRASPAELFSTADRELIIESMMAACDADDGTADGMIFDTQGCGFDPAELVCRGDESEGCLTAGQVAALGKAFTGPVDAFGNQVYPPFPWDPGLNASGGGLPGILASGGSSPVQAQRTSGDFDVDAEAARLAADRLGRLGDSLLANLSTFRESGSKILFYHGMSDPWFSANDTRLYYEGLADENGGAAAVRDFSRLFLVPGMGHCSGGAAALDQFDMLSAIVDWVENDSAPERVVSTGNAMPGRSRPLCGYPEYAHFSGGDPEDAASFECRLAE